MRMHQLFHSNIASEHVVVTLTFGLKVEDALDSFEEVQTKTMQRNRR